MTTNLQKVIPWLETELRVQERAAHQMRRCGHHDAARYADGEAAGIRWCLELLRGNAEAPGQTTDNNERNN